MSDKVYQILDEVDEAENAPISNEVTLASGVKLRIKQAPPFLFAQIERKFPPPPVPEIYDEGKQRMLRNPNHPDYLAAVALNDSEKGLAMGDILFGLGTEVSFVPDDLPRPEDEGWSEDVEIFLLGEEIPKKGKGRYLAWVKYVAILDDKDFQLLMDKVGEKMGVKEEEVVATTESFPGEIVR